MGDRAGNFAIQNSDLVLSLGSRLSIRQVGYNYTTWAREAYVIVNDIDPEELKKPSIHADMKIQANVKDLLTALEELLDSEYKTSHNHPLFSGGKGLDGMTWNETCRMWKEKYPVVLPKHYRSGEDEEANVYALIKELSIRVPENRVTVVGNGSACVVGGHAISLRRGSALYPTQQWLPWVMIFRLPLERASLNRERTSSWLQVTEAFR